MVIRARIHHVNGGIYFLEKEFFHFSLCAKLACCCCALHAVQHRIAEEKKARRWKEETWMGTRTEMKRQISTLGMQANKRMWPVFLMTPLFEKKKKKKKWSEETHSVFLLVSVIAAALWISFPIKIAINHFEQAGWFHEEFDLVNWRCVLQGSYTKLRLTSAVVRQLAYGVLVCIIVLNHEE